jgi:hypothetical protein
MDATPLSPSTWSPCPTAASSPASSSRGLADVPSASSLLAPPGATAIDVPPGGSPISSGSSGSSTIAPDTSFDVDASADLLVAPPPSPPGPRTRLQKGIHNPKQYTDGTVHYGMLASTGTPCNLPAALNDPQWRSAMQDEYDAPMANHI